jgi:hypothetical protein
MLKSTSNLLRADHIFGPIIQIWKDMGQMYFWGSGISLMLNYLKIMTWATPGTPNSPLIKSNFLLN